MQYFSTHFFSGTVNIIRLTELAIADLLADLPGLRHQDTYVPVPYLAARCPYRRANRGQRDPGRYPAEDGRVWLDSHLLYTASRLGACSCALAGGTCGHQYHLWRGYLPGADGYEEADCLLQREPHGDYIAGRGGGGGSMIWRMARSIIWQAALTGATMQMFSHGIITGMLFFCVGVIYDHAHTREIAVFGGVAKRMPMLATLFTFAGLASLGLPGLAGFVAEYMAFTGSYQVWTVVTIISVFTMILTASYLLWMLKRVFYGPFNTKWNWLPDANLRERCRSLRWQRLSCLWVSIPRFLIHVITPSLTHLLTHSQDVIHIVAASR